MLKYSKYLMLLMFTTLAAFSNAQTSLKENSLNDFLIKDGYVPVKMQKFITGHLYVTGNLNGISGTFLIDTGAGATIIEEKREEKFKMKTEISDQKATGAGSSGLSVGISNNNKFVLDKYTFGSDTLRLMNLDHVNKALKSIGIEEIDGVIGADILTSGKAIIDYTNLVIYLKQ
ncbi:MAG: aspartyl protease family protein [Bacteroidetes bacterium]|nr:aspartyl protease family protein [Bacteroidota bacterium]